MTRRMMCLYALGILAGVVILWAATAKAATISTSSLDCNGLHLSYSDFPTTPTTITDSWQYSGDGKNFTTTVTTTGASGSLADPLPELPVAGTRVLVGFSWTLDGSEAQGAQWTNLTCAAPSSPPPAPSTTTTGTTPAPTTPTSPSPGATPPGSTKSPSRAPCARIKRSRIHASIRPQFLTHGIATLRASAPPSVRRIRVTIYNDYARVSWTKTFRRRHLALRLNVTSARIWGLWSQCQCAYGNHRIVVEYFTRCSHARRVLVYNDQNFRKF